MVEEHKLPDGFDETTFLKETPEASDAIERLRYQSGGSFFLHRVGCVEMRPIADGPELSAVQALSQGFNPIDYAARYPDVWSSVGDDPRRLASHWVTKGVFEHRLPCGLKPYVGRRPYRAPPSDRTAVTFFGLFDEPSGLAAAARNYRKALELTECTITSIVVKPTDRFETMPDVRLSQQTVVPVGAINIFAMNADMTHSFFLDGRFHLLEGRYNIGIWFWELTDFPDEYETAFSAYDEIWVASMFCQKAIAAKSPIPVRTMPMLIEVDSSEHAFAREHFDLPQSVYIFACVFDIGSMLDRKNPIAAIQAFKSAFGEQDHVRLVLKYHGMEHYQAMEKILMNAVGQARNIVCIDKVFNQRENSSFKHVVDCLVSPHRSEGFGLNIAEFMALGKPVIATPFGGCEDFLDGDSAYLIPFSLQKIGRQVGPYSSECHWAEPDIDALAQIFERVLTSKEDRDRRASKGKKRIESLYGAAHVASAMRDYFKGVRISQGPPHMTER